MGVEFQSWGRYPRVRQTAVRVNWRDQLPDALRKADRALTGDLLPYGNGRSYGDSCLSAGNRVIVTRGLKRLIAFDPDTEQIVGDEEVLCGIAHQQSSKGKEFSYFF